ncbi:MAG: NAD(P)/FAD-dependent oxidoreductase [Chlamydiota bacterium]
MHNRTYKTIVIGGGAAGLFSAIRGSDFCSEREILLLEKSRKLLSKVKISGGGRCNVTHSCFTPSDLVANYPRGSKELRGPFAQFQPRDTIDWFKKRGVELKTESDGRMFPVTDDSQTIIDCLMKAANNVEIQYGQHVDRITPGDSGFAISLRSGISLNAQSVIIATGSAKRGYELASLMGHKIINPIPSLFTFNIPQSPLQELSGVSADKVVVKLPEFKREYKGPLLITHWGFSGPAVLKLSAYCAKELYQSDYRTKVQIDWAPELSDNALRSRIGERKASGEKKAVMNEPLISLPKQLWRALVKQASIDEGNRWTDLSKSQIEALISQLKRDGYTIDGKTTYKKEFVTCGGVTLSEVNFKTMESKLIPHLYFCGEVLDIDGITGGFNFQAAWTTGWIAGTSAGSKQ